MPGLTNHAGSGRNEPRNNLGMETFIYPCPCDDPNCVHLLRVASSHCSTLNNIVNSGAHRSLYNRIEMNRNEVSLMPPAQRRVRALPAQNAARQPSPRPSPQQPGSSNQNN